MSGTSDSPDSVVSMPIRSAIMPTNGTLSPPVPHPKPIMIDDTVAALTGASAWPNVTLTGSVDCRKNPPMARTTTNCQPVRNVAANRNGVASDERERDDLLRAEAVRRRPAEESADAAGEEVERDRGAGLRDAEKPRRVSITGTNVENAIAVSVRRTTIR